MTDLFDRITRLDSLEAAWNRVRANAGAAGGDGVTVERFAMDAADRLMRLGGQLRNGSYSPGPIRRIEIPKPDGGLRPLAIPSVADRVAQTAAATALTPILDPEMEESSFAYRAGRSVAQAVTRISALREAGYEWVVDGDIERYFENVPHARLMDLLDRLVPSPRLLDLIALWLEASSANGVGLPQGSPLSPLLSNLYLDSVDEAIEGRGIRLVRFADDFVLLCRNRPKAESAMEKMRALLRDEGLRLHPEKTRIVSFDQGFRFLGHLFVKSMAIPQPRAADDGGGESGEELLRWIARDDMAERARETAEAAERERGYDPGLRILYVMEAGRRLSTRNEAFTVEEDGAELIAIPSRRVDRIELGPAAGFSEAAIRLAMASDTAVAFVDGRGAATGAFQPATLDRSALHLGQARHTLDPDLRIALARRIVDGRLRNQRALLRRLNRRRNADAALATLAELNRLVRRIRTPGLDVPGLLGWEGRATALYWRALSEMIEPPWRLPKRIRRPPKDPVNLMLSYFAAMLERDVAAMAARHGLHPGFGVLHGSRDYHAGCVYDLMEEFRAPLVEGLTVYLCNNRIVKPEMFATLEDRSCHVGREGKAALIRGYEDWLARPIKSPRTGDKVSWRRLIGEQAVAFGRHCRDEEPYRPYVMDY
ncbi:MAG: CRISPR-associated endonuclease Cas1 [Thalassobaculaceae bacterium]